MSERTEDRVDAIMADARAGLERRIERAHRAADFGDVIARAHAIDADTVTGQMVEEARRLARVLDIREARSRTEREAELDRFLEGARNDLEAMIDPRLARPLPGLPAPARGRTFVWLGAAAAAAVLMVAAGIGFGRELLEAGSAATSTQAAQVEELHPRGTKGLTTAIESSRPRPKASASPSNSMSIDSTVSALEVPAPEPRKVEVPRRSSGDRLVALGDAAQRLWAGGDLKGAERLLRKVVAIGGRSHHVEMAYGDLFTIVHQRGGKQAKTKLWRDYLRRFPRGRFADDARAGLCRSSQGSQQHRCWQAYLDDFARGSYRAEARRIVQEDPAVTHSATGQP